MWHIRKITNSYNSFIGKPEGKSLFGDVGADGKIILKRILNKCGLRIELDSSGS
jgi:hypothetical protein